MDRYPLPNTHRMTVIIATKGRPKKLLRCLRSIPRRIPVALHATIPEDVDMDGILALRGSESARISLSLGKETIVQSFNLLSDSIPGDVLPVPDDVEFADGFFDQMEESLHLNPNKSVFGAHVTNRKHNDDAVTLVRRQCIDERGFLFDPRFEHFFIDFEIGLWAKKRGAFLFCQNACLAHHHPGVSGEYDTTHSHRRMDKWHHDKAIWDSIRGILPAPRPATAQT